MLNYPKNLKTRNILVRDHQNNTVSHAYMLCGDDEEVLKNLSREFALLLTDGSKIDINEFPNEEKKSVLVSDIDALNSTVNLKPVESERKVYIIDKAESMNVIAQNKLLKTLEEPPKNNIIILNCTNLSNILRTIQSRCKIITNSTTNKFAEQELKEYCKNLLLGLQSSKTILPQAHCILEKKEDLKNMLECFEEIFGEILTGGDGDLKKMYSQKAALEILPKIRHASMRLKNNGNVTSIVDELVFNITQIKSMYCLLLTMH